ncbi:MULTISPECIES: hypothetical protein [Cupriavidus]
MSKRIWGSKRAAARAAAARGAGDGAPAGGLLALSATGILVLCIAFVVLYYGFGWFAPACAPGDAPCPAATLSGNPATIKERVEALYRIANDPAATPAARADAASSLQRLRAAGHVPMAERAAYAHEKREAAERQEQGEQQKAFEEEASHLAAIRDRLMQYPYLSESDRRFLEASAARDRQDPGRVQRREQLELARQRGGIGNAHESLRLYQQRQAEDAQRRQRYAADPRRAQDASDQAPPPMPSLPEPTPAPAPAAARALVPAQATDRSMYLGG